MSNPVQLPEDVLNDILSRFVGNTFPYEDLNPWCRASRPYLRPLYFGGLYACLFVCKHWSAVAVRLLYYSIDIMDNYILESVARNLESTTTFYDYGEYVRKLDLNPDGFRGEFRKGQHRVGLLKPASLDLLRVLIKKCPKLTHLRLCRNGHILSREMLQYVSDECPSLRYLDLCEGPEGILKIKPEEYNDVFGALFRKRPHGSFLKMVGTRLLSGRWKTNMAVLESLQNLVQYRHMCDADTDKPKTFELIPSVKEFYIQDRDHSNPAATSCAIEDDTFQRVLKYWGPTLVVFDLHTVSNYMTDDFITRICESCPHLRRLFLPKNNTVSVRYTDVALERLGLLKLQGLSLTLSQSASETAYNSLFAQQFGLEELSLTCDSYGVKHVCFRLPRNLKRLQYNVCPATGLLSLMEHCSFQNLTHLRLVECSLAVDEFGALLVQRGKRNQEIGTGSAFPNLIHLEMYRAFRRGSIDPFVRALSASEDDTVDSISNAPSLLYLDVHQINCTISPVMLSQIFRQDRFPRLRSLGIFVQKIVDDHLEAIRLELEAAAHQNDRCVSQNELRVLDLTMRQFGGDYNINAILRHLPYLEKFTGARKFKSYDETKYGKIAS